MSQFAGQFEAVHTSSARPTLYEAPWRFEPKPFIVDVHRDIGVVLAQARYDPDSACQLCSNFSRCVIAWDGRLDNGPELATKYNLDSNLADATLALGAYESGGAAALGDLIGDWSAAIWDARRRIVVIACDYAGVRPVYYQNTDRTVTWASSLRHLSELTGVKQRIDEDFLCEYLYSGGSAARTPYCGIFAVPPGNALIVNDLGRCSLKQLWAPNPEKRIRLRDDCEYRIRFLELLTEAVAVRLPTAGPVYAELSGGLDSSTIVAIAHKLIAMKAGSSQRLVTVSYCEAGSVDEPFISSMEQTFELDTIHLQANRFPLLGMKPGSATPQWWEARHEEIARLLATNHSNVLLTGQIGDLIMGNWTDDWEQVADLIRVGSLIAAVRTAFEWGVLLRRPIYSILGDAIRINLWPRFDLASEDHPPNLNEDSMLPQARDRARQLLKKDIYPRAYRKMPPSQRKHFLALKQVLHTRHLTTPEPLQHVRYTHPYSHRPLVEFMMSIPTHVVSGPGQPRRLMRAALQGVVPPQVLARRSKASYDNLFAASLIPCAHDLLREPNKLLLAEHRIADGHNLMSRLRRFVNGLECNASQLRVAILLELWLRNQLASHSQIA